MSKVLMFWCNNTKITLLKVKNTLYHKCPIHFNTSQAHQESFEPKSTWFGVQTSWAYCFLKDWTFEKPQSITTELLKDQVSYIKLQI